MRLDTAFTRSTSRFFIPRVVKFPVLLSFLLASINGFVTAVAFQGLQPLVPLWYSLTQLEDQLAPKAWLFTLPIFSLSLTLIHLFILRYILKYEEVVMQLFAWMTMVINSLLLLSLIRIILIV